MLTLTFVRHGQTDCSLENRFCGTVDIPLNSSGQQMAEALGKAYAGESWQAIYSSPLQRARDTAAPLANRLGMQVQIEDGLREIGYGEWEGQLEHEIETVHKREFDAWAADPGRVSPPGGETAYQVAERALAAVHSIQAQHADGHVMVVTHKGVIRIVVCALLGIEVSLFRMRIAQEVGASTSIQFKETGPLLLTLNDVSLLPPHLRHAGGT
jgi:alpha-ribazole phosphatase